MQKPNNYDTTQEWGYSESIELGGHIMRIVRVEETHSTAGNEMLKIYLDTAKTDVQPDFFKKKYDDDTRPARSERDPEGKIWGCISYQLTEDGNGNCNRGLKTFISAVEKSNAGFMVQWGDNFAKSFENKFVGGIFREEEYINKKGKAAMSPKMFAFCTVDEVKNGVKIPEPKMLNHTQGYGAGYSTMPPVGVNYQAVYGTPPPDTGVDDYPF